MIKLGAAILAASLTVSAAAAANAKDGAKGSNDTEALSRGLQAIFSQGQGDNPPGQASRPQDPDQGDDNASDRAINVVCTKNTPAAERSAICDDFPASP